MTDLDVMSALAWLLCAVATVGGFAVGAWRRERTLDRTWEAGYREGHDDGVWAVQPEMAAQDQVRDVPPAAGRELGDDGGGEGAPGVLAGGGGRTLELDMPRCDIRNVVSQNPGRPAGNGREGSGESLPASQDVPRPGVEAVPIASAAAVDLAGPGHQRGYGPYLKAIGRDDPAGWYANLTAGEPPPEPGPRAEPAWVERLLHQGAISTAWCEATLHDTAEYFRADEAAVDCQIERWVKAARFQLVGSRSWPPPELAGVA